MRSKHSPPPPKLGPRSCTGRHARAAGAQITQSGQAQPFSVSTQGLAWTVDMQHEYSATTGPQNFNTIPALRGGAELDPAPFNQQQRFMVRPYYAACRPPVLLTWCFLRMLPIPLQVYGHRLQAWMRTSSTPSFRKPWGKLDVSLKANTQLTVAINNRCGLPAQGPPHLHRLSGAL